MRPDIVVVIAPDGQFLAGIREAVEYLLIQALVSQTAVETFDQAVLLRLTGVDVVPGDAGIARLLPGRRLTSIAVRAFEDRRAGELGAIIADDAAGLAINPDQCGQFPRHPRARKAGIGNQRKVLSGAVVDDSQNAEFSGRAERVRYRAMDAPLVRVTMARIQRPAHVWAVRYWHPLPGNGLHANRERGCSCAACPFSTAPPPHRQAFLFVKSI
jgi:hypothetical protein